MAEKIIVRFLALIVYFFLRDWVSSYFMALVPVPIDQLIVCIGLGDEVSSSDVTAIRVLVGTIEQHTVEVFFSNGSKGIIKSQIYNLRK